MLCKHAEAGYIVLQPESALALLKLQSLDGSALLCALGSSTNVWISLALFSTANSCTYASDCFTYHKADRQPASRLTLYCDM